MWSEGQGTKHERVARRRRRRSQYSTPTSRIHDASRPPPMARILRTGATLGILFRVPVRSGWVMDGRITPPAAQAAQSAQPPNHPGSLITSKGEAGFKNTHNGSNSSRVDPNTSLKAAHRLAHLVRREGLLALEGVRIEAALVELGRALKGRHRLVVLALQREAVAHRDPRLGCFGVNIEHLLCEPRERRGALEVPKERGVVVEVPYPVWVE
jgi:hypothetical protein